VGRNNGETINKENNEKTNNKGNKETANEIKNIKITIIKRKRSGLEGFDLLFEGKHYKEILGIILEKGKQFGMIKSSNEVHEILRLEAGIPLFGVDFDEKTVLPEIGEKAGGLDYKVVEKAVGRFTEKIKGDRRLRLLAQRCLGNLSYVGT